jgi:hypothetical protein
MNMMVLASNKQKAKQKDYLFLTQIWEQGSWLILKKNMDINWIMWLKILQIYLNFELYSIF